MISSSIYYLKDRPVQADTAEAGNWFQTLNVHSIAGSIANTVLSSSSLYGDLLVALISR